MHRQFRKLLENATGISQYIIAIVLDIRGFTPFCKTVDSVEVATYIKQIYMKILDNYFSNASFYKPTGDGLLVVIRYDEESLEEVVNSTMESCLKLLEDFDELCKDEAMINFPTPSKIGIGITRGSACCITSKEKILDYSGRVLNLASRLMDIARPGGIVFDSSFGLDLLLDEKKEFFLEENNIYIRGIAEEKPITVYYTKKYTLISDVYKHLIKEPRWETIETIYSLKELRKTAAYISIYLKNKPLDKKRVFIKLSYSKEKFRISSFWDITDEAIDYKVRGKTYCIRLKSKSLLKYFETKGLEEDTKIRFQVHYPVK